MTPRQPALDLRPVLLIVGLAMSTAAMAMLLPAAVDALLHNPDWLVFASAAAVSLFVGLTLVLANRTGEVRLSLRQSFLLTTAGWLAVAVVGALPFAFSGLDMSVTDAFFESVSGITTTGASVIPHLEASPPGILLWRAILQWLGGIGVIIMAVAVLPALKIGGMQIFRLEGSDATDRLVPRAARVATALAMVYLGLTAALAIALWLAGMTGFEALVHAMSTISTGGFSTSSQSMASFSETPIRLIVLVGMIGGGLPFVAYLQLVQGNIRAVRRDTQIRWYAGFLVSAGLALALWLWLTRGLPVGQASLHGFFTAVSVMTGTGYWTMDFGTWSGLPLAILFFLMFVGGCAGSTAGGIKVFRFQILFANARVQLARLLSPNAVRIPHYNRRQIPDEIAETVMGFLFVYALSFATLAMLLAMLGLDFMAAVSSAASAIGNVGPAFGEALGPSGSYAALPASAKWLLAGGMLLGRLEMFVILVLFAPTFWRS